MDVKAISNPEQLGKDLEAWRHHLMTEEGTEPPCPFCQTPRVTRSSYIRCNQCGVNWLDEERKLSPDYLDKDPRLSRPRVAPTNTSASKSAKDSKADVDAFTVPSL